MDIDPISPTWKAIQAWAETHLHELREVRESPQADLRRLDQSLGSVMILKELLDLPATQKRDRVREPVMDDSFDIPPISGVTNGSST